MRRTRERKPADRVQLTLILDRATVDEIDLAALRLGIDRQEVLERGFTVLTSAVGAALGHYQHTRPEAGFCV